MHQFGGAVALLVLVAAIWVPTASAQTANGCSVGQTPHYVFGFADLRSRLGDWMGNATTCEFADPNGTGDVHQRTTAGLAFWRKSTNTPTFTNGSEHWALTSRGFLYWQGSSIDPPANAVAAQPNAAASSQPPAQGVTRPGNPAPPQAPQTYATAKGPKTERQLREDLTAAGYGGPWDVASMLAAFERANQPFYLPVWEAPGSDGTFWCVKANPSCARDPWWVEWDQLQQERLVQYRFLGPGLVTEQRFVEVVWLLWQWPEGRALLKDAADDQVMIVSGPESGSYAFYVARLSAIHVNSKFTETSTWMIADVVAHELKHASDKRARLFTGSSFSDCITREQRAYGVEQRFLYWIWNRFGGFPTRSQVALRLGLEDFELFDSLMSISYSPDVAAQAFRDYRRHCLSTV